MIEDDGKVKDAANASGDKPPKIDKLLAGITVAYSLDKKTYIIAMSLALLQWGSFQ